MTPEDFDYELPEAAIAQHPVEPRDSSRLLVDSPDGLIHKTFVELPDLLGPGDVVVLNDTRVLPARVQFFRETGGRTEVLLLEPRDDGQWECLVKPSKKVASGATLTSLSGLAATVGEDLGQGRRLVTFESDKPLLDALEVAGEMPLPPYIGARLDNSERYQTVYSNRPASAAAPTAGLHMTDGVMERAAEAGAAIVSVELVVGLDTFRPMNVENIDDHEMHSEAYSIRPEVWDQLQAANRVIAVGTTSVRALESAAATGQLTGRTELFIKRPYEFAVVDAMVTNFHLPKSTLLVMIDAFVGPRWREIYATALANDYRFLSFGDAMFLRRSLT